MAWPRSPLVARPLLSRGRRVPLGWRLTLGRGVGGGRCRAPGALRRTTTAVLLLAALVVLRRLEALLLGRLWRRRGRAGFSGRRRGCMGGRRARRPAADRLLRTAAVCRHPLLRRRFDRPRIRRRLRRLCRFCRCCGFCRDRRRHDRDGGKRGRRSGLLLVRPTQGGRPRRRRRDDDHRDQSEHRPRRPPGDPPWGLAGRRHRDRRENNRRLIIGFDRRLLLRAGVVHRREWVLVRQAVFSDHHIHPSP